MNILKPRQPACRPDHAGPTGPASSRSTRLLLALFVSLPVFVAACSSTKSGAGNPYSSSNRITREEIEASTITFANAYEIVEHLRPQWLIKRGIVNIGQSNDFLDFVVVYEDRNRLGDTDALRGIAAVTVRNMRYLSPGEAIPLGPPDHPHGAIQVFTRP